MKDYNRNIIKQCFSDNNTLFYCMARMSTEMFTDKVCRNIWEIYVYISKQNINISFSSIEDTISKTGNDVQIFEQFQSILQENYQDESEWKYHVSSLVEDFCKKEIRKMAEYILENHGLSDAIELKMVMNETLQKIEDTEHDELYLNEALDITIKELKQIQKGDMIYSYRSGFSEVDARSPICRSYQVLISGASGSGKTALMIQLMKNMSELNENMAMLFFTLEMKTQRLIRRMFSNHLSMSEDMLVGKSGYKMSTEEMRKVSQLSAYLKKNDKYCYEFYDKEIDIFNIARKAKKFVCKHEGKNIILICDNVDKIKSTTNDANSQHNLISQTFLSLKQDHENVTNLILHHQTKETEKDAGNDYRPSRSGIRGSAKLVDDADTVWLTYRPDAYDDIAKKYPEEIGKFALIVDKNRDGEVGFDIILDHRIKYSQFRDVREKND